MVEHVEKFHRVNDADGDYLQTEIDLDDGLLNVVITGDGSSADFAMVIFDRDQVDALIARLTSARERLWGKRG